MALSLIFSVMFLTSRDELQAQYKPRARILSIRFDRVQHKIHMAFGATGAGGENRPVDSK